MIVDTSALVAVLKNEAPALRLVECIASARTVWMSAASFLEAAIVIDSYRDPILSRRIEPTQRELGIALAPVTASQADIARQAYRDYGKGSGHPAQLNFGDCFAYALASEQNEPLLWVGDAFGHTDLTPALTPA